MRIVLICIMVDHAAPATSRRVVEVEISQEARFVLWALRCCALDHQRANPDVHGDIARGFELADALETLPSFRAFALHLQAAAPGVVWHGPACGCVSSSEMHVLHALAQVADHLRAATAAPADGGESCCRLHNGDRLDGWARHWLAELNRAGIEYPGTTRLIEALTPLQMLADRDAAPRGIHELKSLADPGVCQGES